MGMGMGIGNTTGGVALSRGFATSREEKVALSRGFATSREEKVNLRRRSICGHDSSGNLFRTGHAWMLNLNIHRTPCVLLTWKYFCFSVAP